MRCFVLLTFAVITTDSQHCDEQMHITSSDSAVDLKHDALHRAAVLNELDTALRLLQQFPVDAQNNHLETPLHKAAEFGALDVGSALLENGAAVDALTDQGYMPVHYASHFGHVSIVRLLLAHSADVNSRVNDIGHTPLILAAEANMQAVLRLLLEHNATTSARTSEGFTALHAAAHYGHHEIVAILLEYGASTDVRSDQGDTPLVIASTAGHWRVAELLRRRPRQPPLVAEVALALDDTHSAFSEVTNASLHELTGFVSAVSRRGGAVIVRGLPVEGSVHSRWHNLLRRDCNVAYARLETRSPQ